MSIAQGLRVGRYEVVRKLAQGGFGVIYIARDVELDREVALKFLRPEHVTRQDIVQRFLQEARSAAKIPHAGIVTVFECAQVHDTNTRADGTVYIAMELLHGESLHMRLKREGRLPQELAINIARQVCSALMAAHAAGIVHRDLKPDNLFLVADSAVRGGVRVKILDFGVAKLADGQFDNGVRTHSAMLLGTPMYMSPEQCKSSAKVDHRSDIYAVGCILFQLLTGRAPYEGDAGELIAKHQLAPVPTPRSIAPELPAPLDVLVTQMLAKAPDERPATMGDVESALASIDVTDERPPAKRATTKAPLPAPTSVTTLFEGIGEQTKLEEQATRRKLVIGAVVVIAFGVLLGVIVSRTGGDVPAKVVEPTPAPVVLVDAALTVAVPNAPIDAAVTSDLASRCKQLAADRAWAALVECGDDLAKSEPLVGKEMHDLGVAENNAESMVRKMRAATSDAVEVRRLALLVPETSVYANDAADALRQANEAEQVVITRTQSEKQPVPKPTPTADCDAEAAKAKGDDYLANGMDTAALAQFETSLRCKYDDRVIKVAFLAACRSKQTSKAKLYFAKLPSAGQATYAPICLRFGVTVP